jgi:hypothetical protein
MQTIYRKTNTRIAQRRNPGEKNTGENHQQEPPMPHTTVLTIF